MQSRAASSGHRTQAIAFTSPPSTRIEDPFIPAASGLQTKATTLAISSTVSNRLSSEVGRTFSKNSCSNSANGLPPLISENERLTDCGISVKSFHSEALAPCRAVAGRRLVSSQLSTSFDPLSRVRAVESEESSVQSQANA